MNLCIDCNYNQGKEYDPISLNLFTPSSNSYERIFISSIKLCDMCLEIRKLVQLKSELEHKKKVLKKYKQQCKFLKQLKKDLKI